MQVITNDLAVKTFQSSRVCWSLEGCADCLISTAQAGIAGERGLPKWETGKRGFGTRLITGGVSREFACTVSLEFAPGGLRCILDVPLDGPHRSPHSWPPPTRGRSAGPEGLTGP